MNTPKTILVVEDDPQGRDYLSYLLSKIGSTKPFDPALFPEEQVRVLSEQLIEKVQELTAINEKLQATTALLRSSEEQYRLLFEGNPNPMWVFDQETLCFLAVNEAAVSRYGYTREEFLKMTIRDIRPNSEQDRLDEELLAGVKRVIASEIWHHEKKDRSLRDVGIFAHPIAFNARPAKLIL